MPCSGFTLRCRSTSAMHFEMSTSLFWRSSTSSIHAAALPGDSNVVAVFVLAVVAWHWSRASAPVRRAMTPAAWAALPVFGTLVAQTLAGVGVVPSQIQAVTVPFEWLTFAILPVGLLIGVLRTRLGRAAVGDLVVELSRLPVTGTLRDSLARTVGD